MMAIERLESHMHFLSRKHWTKRPFYDLQSSEITCQSVSHNKALPAGKNSICLKDQYSAKNLDFEDFHLKLDDFAFNERQDEIGPNKRK